MMNQKNLREKIFDLLMEREMSVSEIIRELGLDPSMRKEVFRIIESLGRIAKRKGMRVYVMPATCLSCGFTFRSLNPSKCPECRSERISEAKFIIK
ncbi:putative transcriptional regulator containing an HTH domain fused to a Zn-ribbon [Geoglobus ahangari]|uniref:Putative transcriptional regulator containing an HTH domain fused to a Zn-ribbon n=1 Tax=Geoglobus ahangari TaxID=113653 RepID=A0A0F7IJQ6_9EURY|nr:transcriptional regulator [Geoglobus ahangari]AKG92469.1 putative transcriptional regulator containing an HTH domain fused to a Zn-ribbon [Geoglobus ahangari]